MWIVSISLPENKLEPFPNLHDKWVVILQQSDIFPNHPQIAVVVASSIKAHKPVKAASYNHFVGPTDPEAVFKKPSVIDCRAVFTLPRDRILAGAFQGVLRDSRMAQINAAVASGLDLFRPRGQPRPPVNP